MKVIHFKKYARRAAAVVEFALVLPILLVLFLIAADFARVYRFTQAVADCARTGAMYLSNPDVSVKTPYATVEAAVLASAGDLSPLPTVTSRDGIDDQGNRYYEVTVSYQFKLFSRVLGAPSQLTVTRAVQARMYPAAVMEKEA